MNLQRLSFESSVIPMWTEVLLASSWLLLLLGTVLFILLRWLPQHLSTLRYAICVTGLFVTLVSPLVITWFVRSDTPLSASELPFELARDTDSALIATHPPIMQVPTNAAAVASTPDRWSDRVARIAFVAWCVGQCYFALRMLIGIRYVRQLRKNSQYSDTWTRQLQQLSGSWAWSRLPEVRFSDQVIDAMAAGFYRQMIVIPAAWLNEIPCDMMEAVLAHELAHLQRFDLWISAAQRIAESVFFFHPVVWWLSRQLRIEREAVCDSAALRHVRDRTLYARTLEFAARYRAARQTADRSTTSLILTLGDDRMSTLRRIQQILDPQRSPRRTDKQGSLLAITFVLVTAVMLLRQPLQIMGQDADAKTGETNIRTARTIERTEVRTDANETRQPHEGAKVSLPEYRIESPDLLKVDISGGDLSITTECLVGADGTISLGSRGNVYVTGMTVEEAKSAIQDHLTHVQGKRVHIELDVMSYNSKFYSIVNSTSGHNEVLRMPVTGNETVLDAIAQLGGLTDVSTKKIWISRPNPNGTSPETILSVDWHAISRGASTETNYQILPGDRIHVENVESDAKTSAKLNHQRTSQGLDDNSLIDLYYIAAQQRHSAAALEILRKAEATQANEAATKIMREHFDLRFSADYKPTPMPDAVVVMTYNVSDLVFPKKSESGEAATDDTPKAAADFEPLIKLIKDTVEPDSWEQVGGEGVIQAFPTNLSLVVSNSQSVHDEIAELLVQLRELKARHDHASSTDE